MGFANYFRDHVDGYGEAARPLYELIRNYQKNKNKPIVWTDELKESFKTVVHLIHNCPKLFFLDDYSPIFLYTDASDYGCGAYLYQFRITEQYSEGRAFPIAFISKSFDARMRRWNTPQKEGFAIYYALLKLDYLLRDRKFQIRTDHKNLSILRGESYMTNLKVQRWFNYFPTL